MDTNLNPMAKSQTVAHPGTTDSCSDPRMLTPAQTERDDLGGGAFVLRELKAEGRGSSRTPTRALLPDAP